MPLYLENHLLTFYLEMINKREYYSFSKILCGFWEKMVIVSHKIGSKNYNNLKQHMYDQIKNYDPNRHALKYSIEHPDRLDFHPRFDAYYPKLLDMLMDPPTDERFFLGVGEEGFKGYRSPYSSEVRSMIEALVSPKTKLHEGLVWKESCRTGDVTSFWNTIRNMNIVVVGMKHLRCIKHRLNLRKFHFVQVEPPVADVIDDLVEQLKKNHANLEKPAVYLFQLGGSGSAYVIRKLHGLPSAFLIDVGRMPDIWGCDPYFYEQPWVNIIPQHIKNEIGMNNRLLLMN